MNMKIINIFAAITMPIAFLIYLTKDNAIWDKYKKIIKKDELKILDIIWLSIGIVIIAFAIFNLFFSYF